MALLAIDSEVLWLNIMNGTLGVVVLICCLVVAGAIVYQFAAFRRQRAKDVQGADAELKAMLADKHAFNVPGLGLTMADGGEPKDDGKKAG